MLWVLLFVFLCFIIYLIFIDKKKKEYDIYEFEVISSKEDREGYRLKSAFDNRKL